MWTFGGNSFSSTILSGKTCCRTCATGWTCVIFSSLPTVGRRAISRTDQTASARRSSRTGFQRRSHLSSTVKSNPSWVVDVWSSGQTFVGQRVSVEETKPRLIYDARPLNKFFEHLPLSMDTVGRVGIVAFPGCFMTSLDDSSDFHHVLIHPSS